MLKKLPLKIVVFLSLMLLCISIEATASEIDNQWQKVETRHTIILYPSMTTLEQFQKSVHFGNGWWASSSKFATFSDQENQKITTLKIDAVFKRVQEILDMRKKFKKVKIILYPDKTSLENAYTKTYSQKCPFKAWYDYKTNTISLNARDCSEGMLAHEIAHSIIDNFLEVRPPKNTAEILARYVDTHLH